MEKKQKLISKILIADDDLEIQELLKFTFEAEHYNVIIASDGAEAVAKVREERPDVIILDVNMPKMNGYEVCQKIREDSATCLIPIIMLTSLNEPKDRITGIKLGADEFLAKPFEPYEIVARVEGLLRRIRESLAANPLTGLPGNVSIENEIKTRLELKEGFALIYADVDNFKAFNDKYGFEKGDAVIRLVAIIIRSAVTEVGNHNDFIGHIGGEDYIILTTPEKSAVLAESIIKVFDSLIPNQYEQSVREKGYIWSTDRKGQEVKFPLMTVSLGVAVVEQGKFQHYSQVVELAKDMMKIAKSQSNSAYVVG